MTPIPTLDELSTALDLFHANLSAAQGSEIDMAVSQHLAGLADKLKSAHAQFVDGHRELDAALDRRLAETQAKLEETVRQINAAREKLATATSEAESVVPMPALQAVEPPLDPELGPRLRLELLDRFGDSNKGTLRTSPDESRDLWEDWKWKA